MGPEVGWDSIIPSGREEDKEACWGDSNQYILNSAACACVLSSWSANCGFYEDLQSEAYFWEVVFILLNRNYLFNLGGMKNTVEFWVLIKFSSVHP